jgi:hypothetical protein
MTPKSTFSLAVRILGLVFLFRGLAALPAILSIFPVGSFGNFFYTVVSLAWPFVVAIWLIKGAPLLVHTAYPNPES